MKSIFGGPVRGHVQVEQLSAYLDQQASPAERAYIDAHLQQCTECRAELDSLRRTVFMLHALPRVAVPRAFTLSEAQVGIRRPAAAPGWFGGFARGLGAVAAIALVAFVAVTVLRPEQAPWNPSQTIARAEPTTVVTAQEPACACPDGAGRHGGSPGDKRKSRRRPMWWRLPLKQVAPQQSMPEPEPPSAREAAPAVAMDAHRIGRRSGRRCGQAPEGTAAPARRTYAGSQGRATDRRARDGGRSDGARRWRWTR